MHAVTINRPGLRGCTYSLGCRAARLPGRTRCLEHPRDVQEQSYALNEVALGLVRDFSGVTFSDELFAAVRVAAGSSFGAARFEETVFTGDTDFSGFEFTGATSFEGARFRGEADFSGARFHGPVSFVGAVFERECRFDGSAFLYDGATYRSQPSAADAKSVDFTRAIWQGHASFDGIWVARKWVLTKAHFQESLTGKAQCEDSVVMNGATLEKRVKLTLNTTGLDCQDATFNGGGVLRLRNATVLLADAVLRDKLSVIHDSGLLQLPPRIPAPGRGTTGARAPKPAALRHVDASQLVLVDLDLSECRFAEAHRLDLLDFRGCTFDRPPQWRRTLGVIPIRPVKRDVLADETSPDGPGPSAVAALYRQLRKALEDGKNEPGAGDFYYGEMEMRRRRRAKDTSTTERWLLHTYWLVSGYGLRATRALGWLLAAVIATITLMMGVGLPDADPEQTVTGGMPAASGRVELTVQTPDPELTLPLRDRFTLKRANSALKVVLNSVVFRSSGQNLTTWGTYVEMASRFTEPVLLGLAGLAIHGRLKRG